jgi:sporulation protein YlmC with PRC-barrel domain
MLEDLHIGATVTSSDKRQLGTLERIIIERAAERVTHIVVDPGLLESGNLLAPGGWEKPRARLVPFSDIVKVARDSLELSIDQVTFTEAPLFERELFVDADPQTGEIQSSAEKPRFRLGELLHYISTAAGLGAAPYEPTTEIQFQESSGSAEIAAGTPVWRQTPHQEIGVVERLLVDPQTQHIRAFVLRRKGVGNHLVQLPIESVANVQDGVVHVSINDSDLAKLAPFDPDQ